MTDHCNTDHYAAETLAGRIITATNKAMMGVQELMKIQARMRREDFSPHDAGEMCARLSDLAQDIADQVQQRNIGSLDEIVPLIARHLEANRADVALMSADAINQRMAEDHIIMEAWGAELGLRLQLMETLRSSPLGQRYGALRESRRQGRS